MCNFLPAFQKVICNFLPAIYGYNNNFLPVLNYNCKPEKHKQITACLMISLWL